MLINLSTEHGPSNSSVRHTGDIRDEGGQVNEDPPSR